jgi:chromate transporter
MFVLFTLSYVYVVYGSVPWIASVFSGLKPAVMAIVASAVIRIGKKALKKEVMATIAAAAFVAIFFFKVPFPLIVLGAGVVGLTGGFVLPDKFNVVKETGAVEASAGYVVICREPDYCHVEPSMNRNLILFSVVVLLWLGPMLLLFLFSSAPMFFREGLFFTKAAFLTFGGAYAVLPYIAQAGVEQFSWLTPAQMMDGLGLAETTPGPLIMVVQFVGFMAGWNYPGSLTPLMGGFVGSVVATYFTFLPCFLFIFLGGPYIEKFRDNVRLSTFLSGITAAVVGVVLNLAVWFAMHVLFSSGTGFNWFAAIIGTGTFVALQWGRLGIVNAVLLAGSIGLVSHFVPF